MWPLLIAAASASISTTVPRLAVSRQAPFFMCASSAAPIMFLVCGVSGTFSVTKSAAAREVVARCGGGTLYAAGDSLLDADLLTAADVAIRPAHGELADAGFTLGHLAVTATTGVLAGAELLDWLRTRVAAAEMSVSGRL